MPGHSRKRGWALVHTTDHRRRPGQRAQPALRLGDETAADGRSPGRLLSRLKTARQNRRRASAPRTLGASTVALYRAGMSAGELHSGQCGSSASIAARMTVRRGGVLRHGAAPRLGVEGDGRHPSVQTKTLPVRLTGFPRVVRRVGTLAADALAIEEVFLFGECQVGVETGQVRGVRCCRGYPGGCQWRVRAAQDQVQRGGLRAGQKGTGAVYGWRALELAEVAGAGRPSRALAVAICHIHTRRRGVAGGGAMRAGWRHGRAALGFAAFWLPARARPAPLSRWSSPKPRPLAVRMDAPIFIPDEAGISILCGPRRRSKPAGH